MVRKDIAGKIVEFLRRNGKSTIVVTNTQEFGGCNPSVLFHALKSLVRKNIITCSTSIPHARNREYTLNADFMSGDGWRQEYEKDLVRKTYTRPSKYIKRAKKNKPLPVSNSNLPLAQELVRVYSDLDAAQKLILSLQEQVEKQGDRIKTLEKDLVAEQADHRQLMEDAAGTLSELRELRQKTSHSARKILRFDASGCAIMPNE